MQRPDPSRLVTIAQHYAAARGLSMARVATLVANNGNFFIRLAGGGDVVTGTYNRVLDFFADPANWPDALIPDHVRPLLPVADTTADGAAASPENAGVHFNREVAA